MRGAEYFVIQYFSGSNLNSLLKWQLRIEIATQKVKVVKALGSQHVVQFICGIVEASCQPVGQKAHRAHADADDQRQHDCVLNRSWSILVSRQTAKEIHHGCTSKEEMSPVVRGRVYLTLLKHILLLSWMQIGQSL